MADTPSSPASSPARRGAVIDRGSLLHRNVLESMSEGVLTVDSGNRIGVFNTAASRLLGLAADEVQGTPFAEVFLNSKGLEEFNDAVLGAVYDGAVGTKSTINVRLGDDVERSLEVTTSYLADRAQGEPRRIGIVAVFDDVTEIEALRKAEHELAEATRDQNVKLRDAYREIEEKNQALASALKKISWARNFAMLLVFVLFAGAAWYVWDETGAALREEIAGGSGASAAAGEADAVIATVAPRRLTTTLAFVGRLAPRREVRITSPIAGKVARVLFEYGDRVVAGDPLVELDVAESTRRYRSSRAEYLEARDKLRALENWKNGPEVARVRRGVVRAKLELEARRNRLAQTTLLLRQGIIPASEHESAQRQYDAQKLSHEAAIQDMEAALAKADADALLIARLKLENATTKMQELEKTLQSAVVHASVSGIVVRPGSSGRQTAGKSDEEPLAPGRSVSEGGYLLTLGDLDGLSVTGQIDEVDVMKLRPGQRVTVGGDAFPDLELAGKIAHISSQSRTGGARRVPSFEVTAAIERVSDAQRRLLRLGMSANVVVVVRDEPAALLLPLSAVRGGRGDRWVSVRNKETGETRRAPVEIGTTTLNEVEIVNGLEAGDEVVVSGS